MCTELTTDLINHYQKSDDLSNNNFNPHFSQSRFQTLVPGTNLISIKLVP